MPRWTHNPLPRLVCVYKLTNQINGKIYIGETINLRARIATHAHPDPKRDVPIAKAIVEFGWKAFKLEILETCTTEELLDVEAEYIKTLSAIDPEIGYNVLHRGFNRSGVAHRPEIIAKIKQTTKTAAARGDAHYTRARKDEPKIKALLAARVKQQRLKTIGRNRSLEFRQHLSKVLKGRRQEWNEKPVQQLDPKSRKVLKEWPSATMATKFFSPKSKNATNIKNILTGRLNAQGYAQKTAYGFGWRYVYREVGTTPTSLPLSILRCWIRTYPLLDVAC